jgi:hypothetical protein
LVARTDNAKLLEEYYSGNKDVFATVMLTASNGMDATHNLMGTYQRAGVGVNLLPPPSRRGGGGSSSSSSQKPHRWIYFVFPGFSVSVTGTYTMTVCVNTLGKTPAEAFVSTVGWKASRKFAVVIDPVPPGRPSTFLLASIMPNWT